MCLTQREVYEFIQASKGTYIRWEGGKAIPSDKLSELAVLGFDINFVVTGKRRATKNEGFSVQDIEKGITAFLINTGELGLLIKSESIDIEALVNMAMFTVSSVELNDTKKDPSDGS